VHQKQSVGFKLNHPHRCKSGVREAEIVSSFMHGFYFPSIFQLRASRNLLSAASSSVFRFLFLASQASDAAQFTTVFCLFRSVRVGNYNVERTQTLFSSVSLGRPPPLPVCSGSHWSGLCVTDMAVRVA
jgi:hypothetical protein